MLGRPEIETLRAALLYWQEEICPHGEGAAKPYLEGADTRTLSAAEIDLLRTNLATSVRYAACEPLGQRLLGTELWDSPEEAVVATGGQAVALVLLPTLAAE